MGAADDVWRLVNGFQVTEALHVAATLGVSDLLAAGPRDVEALADEADCHPDALYRLLRALSTVGVYEELPGRRFATTPQGRALEADADPSLSAWARYVGRPATRAAWAGLLDGVRTGAEPFTAVHGMSAWEYRQERPAENALFDEAMAQLSAREATWVLDAYDLDGVGTVVDVGGGRGRLLAEALTRHPRATGVLFDQEHVLADAAGLLRARGVEDRVRLVPGDFFEQVPPGGDVYLLKSIVHDWDDAEAVALLRCCRAAMAEGSRLALVERLLEGPNEGRLAAFSDLNMLVLQGGRERTTDGYTALLDAAGLRLTQVVPTGNFHVLEAVPA